ncbi:hypothetical protein Afil01_34270 [Actinorhabdospora filicis]|uniref:Uncharacterized protein n=1 Tax=Actinorhabdospora filicis TaxID=1785913 RepID=A0A9W6WBD3_9ACTN|nr:DUF6519 domain-containing protein [Actinorhabdospora filicis]GLZ78620.1 hypothetical protein Afil01_34270 [Actinorhabdospora filicis]
MATITPSTFNPLLAHVNVRLQQGVPLVDADWNTKDDIRKFELRAFLKWYVGDGVPEGNDGYKITGGNDTLAIRAGTQGPGGTLGPFDTALLKVGRYIVDGLDVMIGADLDFKAQPLYTTQPGAAARAVKQGTVVIDAIPATGDITVELDVWEWLVTPDDDNTLVLPGLGVETCARTRREWAVRARLTSTTPTREAGHSYTTLARINRTGVTVADTDITDLRQRRLLTPPAHLIADVLGVDPFDYRRGVGRPAVSIREAINALLAGRLPTTPDVGLSPAAGTDLFRRSVIKETTDLLRIVWHSQRQDGSTFRLFTASYDTSKPELGFSTPVQITSTASGVRSEPSTVVLPNGELVVLYQSSTLGNPAADVFFKRGLAANLLAATEQTVVATAGTGEGTPFAVLCNQYVYMFWQIANGRWQYRRYDHTTSAFADAAPVDVPGAIVGGAGGMVAAAATSKIWLTFPTGTGTVAVMRLDGATGALEFSNNTLTGREPFVVAVSDTEGALFFDEGVNLPVRTVAITDTTLGTVEVIADSAAEGQPAVVRTDDGTLSLFTSRQITTSNFDVVLRRKVTGGTGWSSALNVTAHPMSDQFPHAVSMGDRGIWLFWASNRANSSQDIFAKRIITAI